MILQTRVVFVQGLPQNATEDTVLNYFENSRRSGGGAVEEVKIKGNVVRVQFESSEGNSIARAADSFVTRGESARGLERKTLVTFLFFSRPCCSSLGTFFSILLFKSKHVLVVVIVCR